MDRDGGPSPMQKRLKPWFLGIGGSLLLLVLPQCFRELKGGGPEKILTSLWTVGASAFGKEPPLNVRLDRRSEQFGKERVHYLIVTNTFRDGVAPVEASLKRGGTFFPIELPPVIKPYESVEVRLQYGGTKLFIEDGDVLNIECEGYANAWHARWGPLPP